MDKKKLSIITWVVIIVTMMIGGFLGIYLIGKETGEYDFGLATPMLAGLAGAVILNIVLAKWKKKRNGKVPEVDERSLVLMKRYFNIVLYFVLFGSGAILIALYAMGITHIETGLIIVYMMALYLIIGIGALIVKRL
ncbi:hypothetical protein D1B31_13910 [Neobacillus notoginsengisoli]|uniref:DUF2178 domain-containing protein n=1 Tax=Neobacillus notoginsengisoli TaxID=1578198 RepID=A0A417YSU6_9BACI|nr:hypothetical protein [Neobacillus notoginsengisoli]RHW39052.1 hypothetical protein D1B31_13910 [Neobacillus notoginsengisoli]